MEEWVPAEDFIPADVIRWTESIFDRRRKGKALRIGERLLAGEVVERTADGWVRVLVRVSTITKDEMGGADNPPDPARRGNKAGVENHFER